LTNFKSSSAPCIWNCQNGELHGKGYEEAKKIAEEILKWTKAHLDADLAKVILEQYIDPG